MRLVVPCFSMVFVIACGGSDPQTTADAATGNDTSNSNDTGDDVGPEDSDTTDSGDVSTLNDTVDPTPAVQAFCDAARTSVCNWFSACRPTAPFACESWPLYRQLDLACAIATSPSSRGSVAVDLARLESCAATLTSVDCASGTPPIAQGACRPFGTPMASDGEACHAPTMFLSQCNDGTCNLQDSCPGRCEAFLEVGAPCGTGTAVCHPFESFCFEGQCRAMSDVNGSCAQPGNMCRTELRCDPTDMRCKVFAVENEPCDTTEACAAGLACGSGTCRARVASGESCRNDANCPDGHACAPDDSGLVCKALAVENEACGPDGGANCASGLMCANPDGDGSRWICRAPGDVGDGCNTMYCADGLWCNTLDEPAVCRTRGAIDDVCPVGSVGMDSCIDGLFCLAGSCSTPSGLDGVCAPGMPATCQDGFWCKDGVCKAPAGRGDDCDNGQPNACAAGLWCSPETLKCIDLGGTGASCLPGVASCQGGFHCGCNLSDEICGGPNAVWTCTADKANDAPCRDNPECASGFCDFARDPAVCADPPAASVECRP